MGRESTMKTFGITESVNKTYTLIKYINLVIQLGMSRQNFNKSSCCKVLCQYDLYQKKKWLNVATSDLV